MIFIVDCVVFFVLFVDSNGLVQCILVLLVEMDVEYCEVLESVVVLVVVLFVGFVSVYVVLVVQIEVGFWEEEKMMDEMGYSDLCVYCCDYVELLVLLYWLWFYLDDGNVLLVDIVMGMILVMLVCYMVGMDQVLVLVLCVCVIVVGLC